MKELFAEILNISISAGILIVVCILVRLVFKNMPKFVRCLMWLLVAVRLAFPFDIESPFSLLPAKEYVTVSTEAGETYEKIFKDHPGIQAVMIGRGLLADPALAERIKGTEADGTYISRLKEYVRALCDAYFSVYKDERNTLFKMKELWNFLASNTKDSEKTLRLIRRAHDLAEYKATVNRVFDTE